MYFSGDFEEAGTVRRRFVKLLEFIVFQSGQIFSDGISRYCAVKQYKVWKV